MHDDEQEKEITTARQGAHDAQLAFPMPFVEAPELITSLIKRDGRTEPFRRAKIARVIAKAAAAGDVIDEDVADSLALGVTIYLTHTLGEQTPESHQVDSAVEKVLREMGHEQTALAYATYRTRRERVRRLRAEHPEADTPGDILIRTSDERLIPWDSARIVGILIRESGLDEDTASAIALEVEAQVVAADVRTLTAALVREMVGARLLARGLEAHYRRHRRLGVPLYDTERIVCEPNRGESLDTVTPFDSDRALAGRVKKEYALTCVFSTPVAEAHLTGALHLNALECVDRLDLGRVALTPAMQPRPPRADALMGQVARFAILLKQHFAGMVTLDALNFYVAPFTAGLSDEMLREVTVMLAMIGARNLGTGARHPLGVRLHAECPPWLRGVTAVGPPEQRADLTYEAFGPEARRFAECFMETLATGRIPGPSIEVALHRGFFKDGGYGDFLPWAVRAADSRHDVSFVFERYADGDEGCIDTLRPVTAHTVTLNLPRLALEAENENEFLAALDALVAMALQAHQEKHSFLKRLIDAGEVGPLGHLLREHRDVSLFNPARARYQVAVTGLNEAVEGLLGVELHASDEAHQLGIRITKRIAAQCSQAALSLGINVTAGASHDWAIARRFTEADMTRWPHRVRHIAKSESLTADLAYTPGAQLNSAIRLAPFERARLEGQFHEYLPLGAETRIPFTSEGLDESTVMTLLERADYQTNAAALRLV